ncbi:peptide chain release factor N(5)-glutamine methyltransferase [Cellulophaga sp. F20128]|uniref:peptide chain release factor N(5)-glutamine methyltransferase n=1 Tax=Cellulophaga sp. F20128 TaxID=2926413 RepID=UPI001FF43B78|nr:peptide chain release factor N(5)-glutamine methyltransferase [Cellulophaga sp. F20128]MCK0157193.1 peptide chain release factor N(5)-glutamine methyltransferase [Cellulophaga sp. F20128]
MLLRAIKNIYHQELDALYPVEEVNSFFYMTIEHYLKLERFILALQPEFMLSKEEETPLFATIEKLKQEIPIQYILGTAHFMDLDFAVNSKVLIPRPETEELVRWIVEDVTPSASVSILDIGTGSGCIAISLAKNLPNASLYALDVSEEALVVAQKNTEANHTIVTFLKDDILKEPNLQQKFDIIVSNPPYVRMLEKEQMADNVLNHEPSLALFVSDENPLLFYKAITNFAGKHLKENGSLYFETNQYLGKETQALLAHQNFSEIELRKDIYGNDRMLKGKIKLKSIHK